MYIAPDSIIHILNNVPLDNSYRNTLVFSSTTEQANYFSDLSKYTVSNYTYQRKERFLRVGIKADDLYNCNYLMFKNSAYGNKWFYAFITGVEYVNDNASNVTFEIDVMQTWYFNYNVHPCFVEREHSETDVPGDNIVAENINIGDITCNAISGTGKFTSYTAIIATAYDSEGTAGGYQAGLFSGVKYIAGLIDNATQVQQLLEYIQSTVDADKQDSIVSIFVMPTAFYTTGNAPSVQVATVAKPTKIHNYTPKNKKLLTYPYNYLGVDCGNNGAIYRYEWFDSDNCNFELLGTVACDPQIMLVPQSYNGANSDNFNYVEKLIMSDFPQVAYAIDAFRAWLAQEASSTAIGFITGGAGLVAGAMTGNPAAIIGGASAFASSANNVLNAMNRPPQANGVSSGSIDVATRSKDFYFKQMQVSEQYAKIIDEYFNVYGYATNMVKSPNRLVRPHWTYCKTQEACLTGDRNGGCPPDDLVKIKNIYDKGITWWRYGSEVGHYELDNSPV